MRTMSWRASLGLLALAMAAGSAAQAGTEIISNLPGNDGSQTADVDNLRNKGMGFAMPSGLGYNLTSATLRLETFGTNIQAMVEIWDDAGGVPGSMLTALDGPDAYNPSGIAEYDFTPSGQFTLQADTTYWLVAYGTASGDRFDWKASSPSQTPVGIATHVGATFDTDGVPPTNTSSILTSYAIHGTIVPEPAALALLCVGGLLVVRRR